MSDPIGSRQQLPLILVRGFGGLSVADERRIAYQGFNDGTVYPQKRGDNYIYEGLILRLMKSNWKYADATNVVGYYDRKISDKPKLPPELKHFDKSFFTGHPVVIDPGMALSLLKSGGDQRRTMWVFRYYDLGRDSFSAYAQALVRLVDFIRALTDQKTGEETKVNIIAHSMGGLIVRQAIQVVYAERGVDAADYINKVVTLGTPHQGISFQILEEWLSKLAPGKEVEQFSPKKQKSATNPAGYAKLGKHFPLTRFLTVVGTNYRTYSSAVSFLNRLSSVHGEFGMNYNRSDGLVKQAFAQIPGAPRTFVHKCHGGPDSLVTSREAFEIATRFFFGDRKVSLRFVKGKVKRGSDWFGKSEFFLGVSVKPRGVDFSLFDQTPEAENCYGPFRSIHLDDAKPEFGWADDNRLIWEGWLDTSRILEDVSVAGAGTVEKDIVFRLDFYVGERDLLGIGFSDNVVFRKQYYIRALVSDPPVLYRHEGEEFMEGSEGLEPLPFADGGWTFDVKGTGFEGTFRIELSEVLG